MGQTFIVKDIVDCKYEKECNRMKESTILKKFSSAQGRNVVKFFIEKFFLWPKRIWFL